MTNLRFRMRLINQPLTFWIKEATADHQSSKHREPWSLSSLLLRECFLSPGWTSNCSPTLKNQNLCIFIETSDTDFTDLAGGHSVPGARGGSGLIFTSSVCGRFVLVSCQIVIYVYDIRNGTLQAATSIVCPRRIIAMSMDASSGRNAVAALLEGRMGVVCELRLCEDTADPRSKLSGMSDSQPSIDSDDVKSNHQAMPQHKMHSRRTFTHNHISQASTVDLRRAHGIPLLIDGQEHGRSRCTMPVEGSTSTLYHRLCSEEDPPRSGKNSHRRSIRMVHFHSLKEETRYAG